MSRSRLSPVARGLLLLAALGLCACPKAKDPDDDFRRQLLASVANNVVLPTYSEFSSRTAALKTATAALATATVAAEAPTELAAAQAAWGAAMGTWQRAELLQLGPAGAPAVMTGGESRRDKIYSWPTVSPCRVDQELVAQGYLAPTFFETALVNVYGLDALEYLLFHTGPENQCPGTDPLNAGGSWAALTADQLRIRRAAYADAVAGQLQRDADALLAAWSPTGGNFAQKLATAGTQGSPFGTAQEALDQVFAAMFYVDLTVKDAKLAVPAGLNIACTGTTCPQSVESRWAHRSREQLVENLQGFRVLFTGADQKGFDDFLIRRNAPELSTQILQAADAAVVALEAIPGTLEVAVDANPAQVAAAYDAVKALTDLVKTQFVTVLNLRVPQEGAADND